MPSLEMARSPRRRCSVPASHFLTLWREKSCLSQYFTSPCLCILLCSAQMSHFIIKLMKSEHARSLLPPWLKCSVFAEAAWAFPRLLSAALLTGVFLELLSVMEQRISFRDPATAISHILHNKNWMAACIYSTITILLLRRRIIRKSTVAALICKTFILAIINRKTWYMFQKPSVNRSVYYALFFGVPF